MRQRSKIVCVLLFVWLTIAGFSAKAQHYATIDGIVDSVLVLSRLGGDSVYLVDNLLKVTSRGELHVEAGAKICFGRSASLRIDGGRLMMNGTESDSIYLFCDDVSQNWAGIQLRHISGEEAFSIAYVDFVGASTALNAFGSSGVNIRHCRFNNFYAATGIVLNDCSSFSIDSCFFGNCISGVELLAKGGDSEDNRITHNVFDKGQVNVKVSNAGYGYKCHNTVISDNCFQGAATAISFESIGGLSDKDAVNYILNNMISSELPEGGMGYTTYGIKVAMDSLVIRNNVFWSNVEAITMQHVCHLFVDGNTFYDNGLILTNLLASGSAVFTNNVISEARKPIVSFPSGLSRLNGNNFLKYNCSIPLFENASAQEVDMCGNYWDTQDSAVIESVVLDQHDNPSLGEIKYNGYLAECNIVAPVAPPFRVKKQLVNDQWLITWESNEEADLDHYVLFYGDFDRYKFSHHVDSVFDTHFILPPHLAQNVAVAACDHHFDFDVYARAGQSAYAFATNYPYAGADASLCASQSEEGFSLGSATIPYAYSGFVWRTSGTGVFSDSVSLVKPVYYPSEEDFEAGEVKLTLQVADQDGIKSDALQLVLYKEISVDAGPDYYSGFDRPVALLDAWADDYDSIAWRSLGDGFFDDPHAMNPNYYLGEQDKLSKGIDLVLEAWSYCGYDADTVHFDLYEEFSLEGMIWAEGAPCPNAQVLAVAINDGNPFFSGFYRTVSDEDGRFSFSSLLAETYMLYAFPDTLGATCSGTYYLGDLQWNESNMIEVDGDVYDVDIVLPTLYQGLAAGEGRISGVFDYPQTEFRAGAFYCHSWLDDAGDVEFCRNGLSNVGVLLLDAAKLRILGFTLTDNTGAFHFGQLPFGTYYLMADVPRYGRGMCEAVELSPAQPSVENIHLFIDNRGRVDLRRGLPEAETQSVGLFPNPVDDVLTVVGLQSLAVYTLSVYDVLGNQLKAFSGVHADIAGACQVEVAGFPQGVYFLNLSWGNGSRMLKFVKK